VLVNPHDDGALQDAIVDAVEMHRRERRERMERLRSTVRANDVNNWARTFLERLVSLP
jgi:trehalose 6-phosphate synthase